METIGAASGAVLGYIQDGVRGARRGYVAGGLAGRYRSGPYPTPPVTQSRVISTRPNARALLRQATSNIRVRSTALRERLMNRLRNRVQPNITYPNRKQMLKRRRTTKRTTLKKAVAKAVMKQEPAKHYTGSVSAALTHCSLFTWNSCGGITQGTTNAQRDGDAIYLEALKLKGFYQTTNVTNSFTFRVLVGYSGEEVSGCDTTFGTGLGVTDLFLPNTDANWRPNGIINPKAFTVLADRTFDVPSVVASVIDIASFEMVIPLKMKFPYQSSGSSYGKFKNLMVVVTSGVQGGTVSVTSSGSCYIGYDLIFKNY